MLMCGPVLCMLCAYARACAVPDYGLSTTDSNYMYRENVVTMFYMLSVPLVSEFRSQLAIGKMFQYLLSIPVSINQACLPL